MDHLHAIEPIDEVPPVGRCQSYRPGHQTHWIMAKQYRSAPRLKAVIRDLHHTAITLEVEGQTRVWHHHDPARVVAALLQHPDSVFVVEGCTAILIGRGPTYWFYCAPEAIEPCRFVEDPTES